MMLQRSILCLLCAAGLGLPACGSTAVNDDDSPVSSDNLLAQTSLQALQDTTQDDDAEVGATTAAEGADACITATATPSSLDPNDLPSDYSIAWHFNECALGSDVVQSGDRAVTVARARASRTRTLSTTRHITQDGFDGSQLTVQGTDSMTATGLRREGAITRTVDSTSTRVRLNGDGTAAYEITATYTVDVQDTYKALRLTERLTAGTGSLQHNLSGAHTQVTFNALEYVPTCCYPVSGNIVQVTTPAAPGSAATQKTFVFTSTCGRILVNNRTPVTYPHCGR